MTQFFQFLVTGLARGSVFAIVGLGLVIVFKATHLLNFAHGALMTIGAYLCYEFHNGWKWNTWLGLILVLVGAFAALDRSRPKFVVPGAAMLAAGLYVMLGIHLDYKWKLPYVISILLAMIVTGGLGLIIDIVLLRRMRGRPVFSIIMVTFGIAIIADQYVPSRWGSEAVNINDPIGIKSTRILGVPVTLIDVVTFLVAMGVTVAFLQFFKRSRMGTAMRATAYDQEAAIAQGISAKMVFGVSWFISAALAALAGILLVSGGGRTLDSTVGFFALAAFPAIILGGIDSTTGAIVGGMVLGIAEQLCVGYENQSVFGFVPSDYVGQNFHVVLPYIVMVVILLVRPYGFFGTKEVRRV